jgi:hypothetical protein
MVSENAVGIENKILISVFTHIVENNWTKGGGRNR